MTVPPDPQVKTETTDDIDIDMNGVAPTAPAPAHSSESNTSATTMAPEPSDTQQQHQQHQQHHAAPPVPHDPTVAVGTAPPPARKERNLREFLDMMEEHAPIIPDAVTDYYLSLAGLNTSDLRLKRLLALATQKFIADIAADAYQYSRIRQNSSNASGAQGMGPVPGAAAGGAGGGALRPVARPGFGGGGGSGGTAGRTVLTMEDLGSAVGEYGVNTRRPEFYR